MKNLILNPVVRFYTFSTFQAAHAALKQAVTLQANQHFRFYITSDKEGHHLEGTIRVVVQDILNEPAQFVIQIEEEE